VTVEQEEIPALGHTEQTIPGKAASCTEPGLTEGKQCSVCGAVTVEQEEIPAAGHTEQTIPGKAASCTEPGLTEGKQCGVCGAVTVEQKVIPAAGHMEQTIPGTAASCTESGLTEGKQCSVCGVVTVEQEEIPALGHTEQTIPGKAASCTECGLTEGKECTVCGVVTVEQEVIPAKGHHYTYAVEAGRLYGRCHCGVSAEGCSVTRNENALIVTLHYELYPTWIYASRYDETGRTVEIYRAEVTQTSTSIPFLSEKGSFKVFFLTEDLHPWLRWKQPEIQSSAKEI